MKSYKKRIAEDRCQGYGQDYVPFIKVGESKSCGTATAIWDPYEKRMIHCLSQAEVNVYYMIRSQSNVKHIREQYLLDTERMNTIALEVGFRRAPWWTTDFLVTYNDNSQKAFSVKADASILHKENRIYRGKESQYHRLAVRQYTEQLYWESENVEFKLVTNEDINMTVVANMKAVLPYYEEFKVTNSVQKLKYLIAHRDVRVPMDRQVLNFQKLLNEAVFDIDALYEKVITIRGLREERS